ncbi:MAG TPA: class I SAM-dependent methyltransferase [Candidatus Binatia bacterium]|jgi:SAM-dependent methyltransferase|nr:class I SAM-dependent methyltransferase [Candidatus Binatia bacterium]
MGVLAMRTPPLDVLDWGCGSAEYRPLIERLGHRYVGLDSEGAAADILADVHALPFEDGAFDHIITNAVLEHVANPFLAVCELARVMKPGAVFSGSVAFMEPHHYRSRFHLTADAVMDVLTYAGLRVQAIWPSETWLVFDSLARMHGPISGPSRQLFRLAGALERVIRQRHLHPRELRNGRWLRRKSAEEYADELLVVTGQVDFLASR